MSITLELTELSPELEKQLAAMPESERGKFVAALAEKGRLESLETASEDDPAALAYSTKQPKTLSPEAAARIAEAMSAPPPPVTEAMKENILNYKRSVLRSSTT